MLCQGCYRCCCCIDNIRLSHVGTTHLHKASLKCKCYCMQSLILHNHVSLQPYVGHYWNFVGLVYMKVAMSQVFLLMAKTVVMFCYHLKQPKPRVKTLKESLTGVSNNHLSHYNSLIKQKKILLHSKNSSDIFFIPFSSKGSSWDLDFSISFGLLHWLWSVGSHSLIIMCSNSL